MGYKLGLVLAIILIFSLVAVFGAFALVMLAQSAVLVMQSGTIFLMQCSSTLLVLGLLVGIGFWIWRRQKRQSIGQNRTTYVLTAPVLQDRPRVTQITTSQLFPGLFANTNADDLSRLLSELDGNTIASSTPWADKAPWEDS